jgi:hypothetical protein
MQIRLHGEQHLVQLATRIPLRVARQLKAFCVRHDVRLQTFVRTALEEHLGRAVDSPQRSRRRGSRTSSL